MSITILRDLFSTVNVDAFTFEHNICEFFPIKESVHYIPEWWKNIPKEVLTVENNITFPQSTIKRCPGFIDLYKRSLTIPLWSDFIIESNDRGEYGFKSPYEYSRAEPHPSFQFGSAFENFINLKFMSPWYIKEKTGIKFCFTDPMMWSNPNMMNKLFIAQGLMDFKYQCTSHIQAYINKSNSRLELFAGNPIVRIIPMTERKVQVKCHVVSKEEHQKIYDNLNISFWFTNRYNKVKKIIGSKK